MKKKIFALLFVALLSVSLVTGCGSKKDDKKEEKDFDLEEADKMIAKLNDKTDLTILDNGIPKLTLAIRLTESKEKKTCGELFNLDENNPFYTVESGDYCQAPEKLDFYTYEDINNTYKELYNEEAPKTMEREYLGNGGHLRIIAYSEKLDGYAVFMWHGSGGAQYSAYKVNSAKIVDDILTIEVSFNRITCYLGMCGIDGKSFNSKDEALKYAKDNLEDSRVLTIKYKKVDDKYYLTDSSVDKKESITDTSSGKEEEKPVDEKPVEEKTTEEQTVTDNSFDLNRATNMVANLDSMMDIRNLKNGIPKLALAVHGAVKRGAVVDSIQCNDVYGESEEHVIGTKPRYGCMKNGKTSFYNYDDVNKKYKEMFNEEAPKEDIAAGLVNSIYNYNGSPYSYNALEYLEYNGTLNGFIALSPRSGGYSDTVIVNDDFYKVESATLDNNVLTIVVKYRTVKASYLRSNPDDVTYEIDDQQFTNRQATEDYVFSHMDNAETLTVKYLVDGNNFYLQSAE